MALPMTPRRRGTEQGDGSDSALGSDPGPRERGLAPGVSATHPDPLCCRVGSARPAVKPPRDPREDRAARRQRAIKIHRPATSQGPACPREETRGCTATPRTSLHLALLGWARG